MACLIRQWPAKSRWEIQAGQYSQFASHRRGKQAVVSRLTHESASKRSSAWSSAEQALLVVEQELLGVNQRPDDVLVGSLRSSLFFSMCARAMFSSSGVGSRAKASR